MNATTTTVRPPTSDDRFRKRLSWAVAVSLIGNFLLWRGAAAVANHPPAYASPPVEITRVIIDRKGVKKEKVITKKQIERKVAVVRKEIVSRRPAAAPMHVEPRRAVRATAPPPRHPMKPIRIARNPPQGAHLHALVAPDTHIAPAVPKEPTVLPGGNAGVGKPIAEQNPGNATVNPPVAPHVDVKPAPDPGPPHVDPKSHVDLPPHADVKPAPDPGPPHVDPPAHHDPPARKKGPTHEAEPEDQARPEIPDELKHGDFRSFVRVKVEIDADGSFTTLLRTSSGNKEIDDRVLEALRKWKWKPAIKDGEPIKSTQLFKFEFLVE